MKTIIVDDDYFFLNSLRTTLNEFEQIELAEVFVSAQSALEYARFNEVELAFIKDSLPGISGAKLAAELRKLCGNIMVVFTLENGCKISRELQAGTYYYLVNPLNRETVKRVVDNMFVLSSRKKKRVYIQTFGSFCVFVDNVPLRFSSSKAKELLAYLVHRKGNVVDSREGFSVLWEDKEFNPSSASCYRKVLSRLVTTLEDAGISNILRVYPRGRAIDMLAVDCDYYSYLSGNRNVIISWNGEYMSNYSWSEQTLGWLYENRSPALFTTAKPKLHLDKLLTC